ncbi:putative ribonuclease H-like domain-containing protein [Tanacetum coccineum]
MIEGNGPKWLFDIDSLTQSMNYVPVAAGIIINESAGIQEELNAGISKEISQDCIVMPIWKDASYFDSPSKDVDNGEPKSAADDQKQDGDGPDNENDEQDKSDDVSSPKEVNATGKHVNTVSPDVNTGSFKLNVVGPLVNTASSYEQDSPKDMFTMGASHTLEATHVEFFSDEDEPEVDLGNITNSYTVPTTPNTRIHKDHPIENVIGDVKSSVQTRRMTKPTSEQGFLSAVYEQKTHDTLNTCLYACFLSQTEPTSIAKALSDSSWVEAMQEELLQFKLQQVWILVDFPSGKRAIGTKWVFRNKKDERGIVIRNKARLVAQGHRQEEETDEVEEVEEDDEAELKKHLVIVKDDDIAIDAIPLATKPPVIVEYNLLKEGIMVHYQLIRADGSSKRYTSMIRRLQGIDKEDLETLWKLVKTKHGDTRPEDEHERVLWGDLKVMFEPNIKRVMYGEVYKDTK